MKRKAVSGITLILLIISILTLAFDVQPVKASGTIYIKADGSIDPPTANITTVDNVTYTFTGNIYDQIVVERDNIVVDGAGHTVQSANYLNGIGIDLSGRSNVTIKNMEIIEFHMGIYIYNSQNNTIQENNITNNLDGIELRYSSNNSIRRNYVTKSDFGIAVLYSSNNNRIHENNVVGNTFAGIRLMFEPSNNTVSRNNITTTLEVGLVAGGTSNIIYRNNITENNYGISLSGSSQSIYENNITNNLFGIRLTGGSGNLIFHNNIDNRFEQIYIFNSGTNTWDDGYPSGGNYWSDHTGSDLYSGPNQDQLGKDGTVDTPYAIDANNTDDYPLMKPYPRGQHDIGMTNIVPSKTVVGQEFSVYVNVTIFNYGNNTENFNVTIYANSTAIDTLTNITLTSGNSDTITLKWNTTGFDKGNYNISLYATTVPGELYTKDNTYTYWVLITIMGDVDGDRDVDVGDQRKLQLAMFSVLGSPNWDPNADIDCDLDVDVGDQRKQQLHMFESW